MQLSKESLSRIQVQDGLEIPDLKLFELPEKVLQFGTGVLLRGLPDFFIDKANKKGLFNGRIVVVKTTDSDSSYFDKQDCLYTLCVRGVENGKIIKENIINSSISRVLWAKTDWKRILECAHNPEIKIVISNTTERGIELVQDDIMEDPPVSFPGKLLAFLFERFKAFDGSHSSGITIIPTELIPENGSKLESIVLELAHRNNLDYRFIEWLENHNVFCNSLVDRIVPGKPGETEYKKTEELLGYEDQLLINSEVFRLWAIEGDDTIKAALPFAAADAGVVVVRDITLFKELKLRLLNGTHSFSCGAAFLSGFGLTRETVEDKVWGGFMKNLISKEIANAIPYEIDNQIKQDFAAGVLDRFGNPFNDHKWLSISMQYTAKMKIRNVPLLLNHYTQSDSIPKSMALCFAGYLLFMRVVKQSGNKFYGEINGVEYEIQDDAAEFFYQVWTKYSPAELTTKILQDERLWDTDLTRLKGFEHAVQAYLNEMLNTGVMATIRNFDKKQIAA